MARSAVLSVSIREGGVCVRELFQRKFSEVRSGRSDGPGQRSHGWPAALPRLEVAATSRRANAPAWADFPARSSMVLCNVW